MVVFRPTKPMVTGGLYKCGRAIREHNGVEYEYTSHKFLSSDVEVTFSHEDGTLTLEAQIPGITDKSTIAFVSHGMFPGSPDYLPARRGLKNEANLMIYALYTRYVSDLDQRGSPVALETACIASSDGLKVASRS